jgi:Domain of unknown function (DUF4856)
MKIFKITLLLSLALFAACNPKKNANPEPEPASFPVYEIPTTYNFANTNYFGQTVRLDMMSELLTYIKTANNTGTTISATTMRAMFTNQNAPFVAVNLNTSGKQLKDKVYVADQALVESYLDSAALASTGSTAGTNGIAGIVQSTTTPTRKYLCNARGFEFKELVEKNLYGSLVYYQAMKYLDGLNTDDNTTVISGEGTAMEHHADEAFGYFGVPIDFPTNVTGIRSWGNYCNRRSPILNTNKIMMDAFLLCRAAISNKDYVKRDAASKTIKDTWEKVIAATAIGYLNSAKLSLADDAIRNHGLSEAYGCIKALNYRTDKLITNAQLTQVSNYLGDNFYTITISNIDQARDLLSNIYGLDTVKTTL